MSSEERGAAPRVGAAARERSGAGSRASPAPRRAGRPAPTSALRTPTQQALGELGARGPGAGAGVAAVAARLGSGLWPRLEASAGEANEFGRGARVVFFRRVARARGWAGATHRQRAPCRLPSPRSLPLRGELCRQNCGCPCRAVIRLLYMAIYVAARSLDLLLCHLPNSNPSRSHRAGLIQITNYRSCDFTAHMCTGIIHENYELFDRSCDFTAHMCTGIIRSNYKLFVNPLFKLTSIEHVIIGSRTQWKTM